MAQVPTNTVVSSHYRGPDRRRRGLLGKLERCVIHMVRSKWIAALVTAFAVSWCFHVVEEHNDRKIERAQSVLACTVAKVADAQGVQGHKRVAVGPILEACREQAGK